MAESTYTFIEGEPIDVGAAGDNSIVFESGEHVTDEGESGFVFENGIGVGGDPLLWDKFEGGSSGTVTLNNNRVPIDIEHDGGGGSGSNYAAARQEVVSVNVGSSSWAIEFNKCSYSSRSPENNNNWALGVSEATSLRPFEGETKKCIYYQQSEGSVAPGDGDAGDTDFFAFQDSNGDRQGVDFAALDWDGLDFSLRIEYDAGGDARLYVDGALQATITPSYSTSEVDNMRAWVLLEDDRFDDTGDDAFVDAYTEESL
jgi:hypothetical protein